MIKVNDATLIKRKKKYPYREVKFRLTDGTQGKVHIYDLNKKIQRFDNVIWNLNVNKKKKKAFDFIWKGKEEYKEPLFQFYYRQDKLEELLLALLECKPLKEQFKKEGISFDPDKLCQKITYRTENLKKLLEVARENGDSIGLIGENASYYIPLNGNFYEIEDMLNGYLDVFEPEECVKNLQFIQTTEGMQMSVHFRCYVDLEGNEKEFEWWHEEEGCYQHEECMWFDDPERFEWYFDFLEEQVGSEFWWKDYDEDEMMTFPVVPDEEELEIYEQFSWDAQDFWEKVKDQLYKQIEEENSY